MSVLSSIFGKYIFFEKDRRKSDRWFSSFLLFCAVASVLVLVGITALLTSMAMPTLTEQGIFFFFSTEWDPVSKEFGALPFVYGTLVSSFLAILLATPISVGTALLLTKVLPRKISRVFSFFVEMLAAIPSVIFGLWGIYYLAPWLRTSVQPFLGEHLGFLPLFSGPPFGVGMMAAGVILAIMIIPTITSMCREVFKKVPAIYSEGAMALGATKWEVMKYSILKNTRPGIFGAVVLGLGRALGETMAVTMVIGNRNEISSSLFAPGQTLSSVIANEYAEASSVEHLSALAAIALSLLIISLVTNIFARMMVSRLKKGES